MNTDTKPYTYKSTQATTCAVCGEHKHTPLRNDAMGGGYVCLTCIDRELERRKTYIIHILQKQAILCGLNEQDIEWLEGFGIKVRKS